MNKVRLITIILFGCILSACSSDFNSPSTQFAISTPTSEESVYDFRLRQFTPTALFFGNVSYPSEVTSITDANLLRLGCSPEFFSWTGVNHEYVDPTTQEHKRISDPLMQTFLASAKSLHPNDGITSISYCQVENDNFIVIYRVGGCGGGCAGIPNISFGKPDGSLNLVATIQDGTDGAYYGCTPLSLTKIGRASCRERV